MRNHWIALSFLIAVPASAQTVVDGSAANFPQEEVALAMAYVSNGLFDPASAQFFRFTRATTEAKTICGYFNAKNLYGGYVGLRKFGYAWDRRAFVVYRSEVETSQRTDDLINVRFGRQFNEDIADESLRRACGS